jgi:RNA polymerase sigma-70 factor (ECF subfamily)
VDAASGLDRQSFERLYGRLERPLYNVVYRWVWNAADAREIVQEAFVRLWDMRARVRPDTAERLVWRIALNLAASRRRSRKLWGWLGLEKAEAHRSGPDASQSLADHERERAIRAAVEALPQKLREVVMLCELSSMSYAEVAETLSIPVGTVGSRRNAALERLRSALEDFDVTEG